MALFYPRFVVNEFAPVFRLMDDLQAVSRSHQRCGGRLQNQLRSFQPRFDVKENKESYELKGELPGISQENIEVAFTDEKTLVIKGHTESRREEGTRPTAAVENKTEQPAVTEGQAESTTAPEIDTSSYHKASVEDEFEHVSESEATMSGGNPEATPAETPVTETAPTATKKKPEAAEIPRSSRINREEVSASLKDGVLSIIVPKAPAPENKRIEIQ